MWRAIVLDRTCHDSLSVAAHLMSSGGKEELTTALRIQFDESDSRGLIVNRLQRSLTIAVSTQGALGAVPHRRPLFKYTALGGNSIVASVPGGVAIPRVYLLTPKPMSSTENERLRSRV